MNRTLWRFFDWWKCYENPDKSWYGLRHGDYLSNWFMWWLRQ